MENIIYMTREAWVNLLDKIRAKAGVTDLLTPETAAAAVDGITAGEGSGEASHDDWIITRSGAPEVYTNNRVETIGKYAFAGVPNSWVSKIVFSNVKKIEDYAFDAGEAGTTNNIAKGSIASALFPECTEVGQKAFECQNLSGEINFEKLSVVNTGAFAGTGLKSINLPLLTAIPSQCFYQCKSLENFDFTNIVTIGSNAFYGCDSLSKDIDLPQVSSLESYAFCGSGITGIMSSSIKKIGNYAFKDCTALKKADFYLVDEIKANAFTNASNLKALALRSERVCSLAATSCIKGTPIESGEGYIYVPSVMVDSYKAATNWVTYANQIRALEYYTVDGTVTGDLDGSKI